MPYKDNVPDFTFDGANMLEAMRLVDPSFPSQSDKFPDEREEPLYFALSELALHLIRNLEAGDTNRFNAIFDVVERWIVEGNSNVREAAIVGLLEDLQNKNLHHTTSPKNFKSWLRPQSGVWWAKLDAFWTNGTPLV